MKISVLGATGSVGAPTAFYIAVSGLTDELLLVGGKRQNVLEHHAIDISEAASTASCVVRHGSYEDLTGSDIIINAAGAHMPLSLDRQTIVREQARFIRDVAGNIKEYCSNAAVISAVNPLDASNYATFLSSGLNRKQLIGYSMNDSFRFRVSIARELKEEVNRVEGLVIGEHGGTQVPLFSSAKVDGEPARLTEDMKRRIRAGMFDTIKKYEGLKAGRTGGWTCAVGITSLVRAIVEENGTVLPCSVVLDGEYGQHDISMGVPVKLGKGGVQEILEYSLTPDEQEGLKNTVDILTSDTAIVRETFNI